MDNSPVLRQQNWNTIRSDIPRTKGEPKKLTVDSKSSKELAIYPQEHNLENQDPGRSKQVRPHVRPAVSRLPILAKSLHLQTPNEFSQSHNKWEEKTLVGKTRTKKPCTRPVPFNLSQTKFLRGASENQNHNAVNPTRTSNLNKNVCSSQIKTTNRNTKHSGTLLQNLKSSANTSQPLAQSKYSQKTSATASKPVSNCLENSTAAAAERSSAADTCYNMKLLSLKDSHSNSNVDGFQHDHAALLSILRNEGVTSTTSKPYNYLPQRVSIMKTQHKAETNADHGALQSIMKNEGVKVGVPLVRAPSIYTPMRVPVKKNETGIGSSQNVVQFSPNAAALQSILQNEGVKVDGFDGATPRNSVYPAGRGTSIYTAQRVPAKKISAEPSPGSTVAARMQTPVQKWTPQRVARRQPMSSMKMHISQPSPFAHTPGFKNFRANLCSKQEEVVQKLFDEADEEDVILPQTDLPLDPTIRKGEMSPNTNEKEEDGVLMEHERVIEPFIQNPERESVIFFSTGKKLIRDSRFKKVEISEHIQHNPEDSLPVLQSGQMNTAVKTLTKDFLSRTDVVNPAVARLRKRLPLLEEQRLDEEVSTYTSVSIPMVSGFHPPRPRCENPVAAILHFEESTRFVPVILDV